MRIIGQTNVWVGALVLLAGASRAVDDGGYQHEPWHSAGKGLFV